MLTNSLGWNLIKALVPSLTYPGDGFSAASQVGGFATAKRPKGPTDINSNHAGICHWLKEGAPFESKLTELGLNPSWSWKFN